MEKGRDCLPLPKTRRHASRHAPIVRGRYKQSWGEGKRKKREKRREKRRAEKGRERGERARRDLGQFVLYSFSIPRRLSSTLLVATFLFLRFLAEGSVPIDPPGPSKGVVVLLGVATALLLLPLSLLSCFLSPIIPFQPVRMLSSSSSSSSSLDPPRLKSETGAVETQSNSKNLGRGGLSFPNYSRTRGGRIIERISQGRRRISISRYLEGKNGPVDPIDIELISPRHLVLDGWMDGWRRM